MASGNFISFVRNGELSALNGRAKIPESFSDNRGPDVFISQEKAA